MQKKSYFANQLAASLQWPDLLGGSIQTNGPFLGAFSSVSLATLVFHLPFQAPFFCTTPWLQSEELAFFLFFFSGKKLQPIFKVLPSKFSFLIRKIVCIRCSCPIPFHLCSISGSPPVQSRHLPPRLCCGTHLPRLGSLCCLLYSLFLPSVTALSEYKPEQVFPFYERNETPLLLHSLPLAAACLLPRPVLPASAFSFLFNLLPLCTLAFSLHPSRNTALYKVMSAFTNS